MLLLFITIYIEKLGCQSSSRYTELHHWYAYEW